MKGWFAVKIAIPGITARRKATPVACPYPEDVLRAELEQNAQTWELLRRLGIEEGAVLALDFFYETAGPEADAELAEYMRDEAGYHVVVEPCGLKGRTSPMTLGLAALDEWVLSMLQAGCDHGACAFAGWTATVARESKGAAPATSPAQIDLIASVF